MRVSRTTGAMSGLMIVVLGVWGGLVPFIGPYFNFMFGPNATWHYSTNRLWLDILPGAVAVVGGLMIMYAGHRVSGTLGGWLALAAGAWFVIGPTVSGLWRSGAVAAAAPIGAPFGGITRQTIELIGFFYGVGVLIIGLAAFSLGRFVSRPAIVADEMEAGAVADDGYAYRPVAREPVAEQPMDREPVAEQPTDRQPVAEQPTDRQPVAEQPETEQAGAEPTDQPASEQPTTAQEPEPAHGRRQ